MPTTRRTRTVAAAPERVWELLADPHHFPRWWPGVTRMEGVTGERWTQVFVTKKGRPVRVDFRLLESEAPAPGEQAPGAWPPGGQAPGGHAPGGRRRWEQELIGSPFERVLREAITEVRIEAADRSGTRVTIEERHKLRGYSRFVGLILRRASRRRLEHALDGLERACA